MTELLKHLRDLGLPMTSCYAPTEESVRDDDGNATEETITTLRYVSWTTDEAKAYSARDAGATLRPYTSQVTRFTGWEVSCKVVVA